jgi:molybdopterin molybdotransferase
VQYLRATLAPDGTADPVSGPGSHLVASMARADVLIEIPAEVTFLPAGAGVEVLAL